MFIHFLNKTKSRKWTLITVSCLLCFYNFENKKFLNISHARSKWICLWSVYGSYCTHIINQPSRREIVWNSHLWHFPMYCLHNCNFNFHLYFLMFPHGVFSDWYFTKYLIWWIISTRNYRVHVNYDPYSMQCWFSHQL